MSTLIEMPRQPLTQLRRQWWLLLIGCAAGLALAYSLLRPAWETDQARQWLVQAAVFSVFPLWISWLGLPDNHRKGESRLLPTLGAGNLLSVVRGVLIAWLAGFLFVPRPEGLLGWFPGGLFSLMILADIFDGYLARLHDRATLLGERLDMSFDGLGVLAGSLLLVQYGQTPVWYILVGSSRYLFVLGLWLRRRKDLPVRDLPENPVRRQLAGSQMGFIAVLLLPVFSPPGTHLAAAMFALPFLAGFLLDWLAVSGRRVNLPGWKPSRWLPLGLRIAVTVLVIVWLSQIYSGRTSLTAVGGPSLRVGSGEIARKLTVNTALLALPGNSPATWMLVLASAGAALVAFGAAGRLASLGVLFSIGISQQFGNLGALQIWLIVAATAIFYLGTGPYSLWVPEKTVLIRRPGEK
jgi:CDP-diacylglycerol--glycerol-3-phosphate 3-phosphatidyltransferase